MEERDISRGAEKVEMIARGNEKSQNEMSGKNAAEMNDAPMMAEQIALENERAEARIDAAKEKKRKKEERVMREQARKREKAERAEERRQRRQERNGNNGNGKQHAPGFGGWLAAVVSLSLAVLALGAIVTVGYFDLADTRTKMESSYRTAVYEFSEIIERMDSDLAKARIASGTEMQKILTDVLVDSELAEMCVEQFPLDGHSEEVMTGFLNRTGNCARVFLRKLAAGQELTAEEEAVVEYMYESVEKIREALPVLVESAQMGMLDKMMMAQGEFGKKFDELTQKLSEVPEEIAAIFGNEKKQGEVLAGEKTITEEEAMRRAGEYFKAYAPKDMRSAGKTENRGLICFIFEFSDEQGRSYYAQITEKGGKLALFESYEACSQRNYDMRVCVQIARKFLDSCGYEELHPVWVSEAGSECTVDFVCIQEGVLLYGDRIKVKVCTERGVVTGMEAHPYLLNHCERTIGTPTVSKSMIERNAQEKMKLHGIRLALLPDNGQEVLCWEVRGEYGGRQYFAYVDAKTGVTVQIKTVTNTDRGMAIV